MNFTSQICTTEEQSKRLIALGLKAETADMSYQVKYRDPLPQYLIDCTPSLLTYPPINNERFIPAWSLNRLIEMMPNNIRVYDSIASLIVSNEKVQYYFHGVEYSDYLTSVGRWKSGDIYDNIIDCIEWLIKEGYFNKEYLEEHLCGKR